MKTTLWVTGNTTIMYSSVCVLKGLVGIIGIGIYGRVLVKILEIGKKVFTDMKSIPIIFKISEHYCLLLNWKGVDFNVLFCKRAKLQHYNDVYKIWADGL